MRRSDSWVEIAIYVIWAIAFLFLIGFTYVAVHFILKYW